MDTLAEELHQLRVSNMQLQQQIGSMSWPAPLLLMLYQVQAQSLGSSSQHFPALQPNNGQVSYDAVSENRPGYVQITPD